MQSARGDSSCRAVLVYPVSADASADVLSLGDGLSAAFASLPGGARPEAARYRRRSLLLAEPDRAQGCYRKPEAARAEVVQVRRSYPCTDLCLLLPTHAS